MYPDATTNTVVTTYDIGGPVLEKYATILANASSPTTYTTPVEGETERSYRFEPDDMMMMPLPETFPSFKNNYGLIFQKQQVSGNDNLGLLEGATIEIQTADGKKVQENILGGNGSATIDLTGLQDGVYKFVETNAPNGYEPAKDIYFQVEGNTVTYADNKELTKNPHTVNLSKNNTAEAEAVIMLDIKKSGAVLQLAKTDVNFATKLGGSKFKLYAKNGQSLIPVYPKEENGTPFTIPDTGINLYDEFKNNPDKVNTYYVKDGYLIPGLYKLDEITPPGALAHT